MNLDRYYGYRGLVPWEVVQGFPEQRYSLLALAPDSSVWLAAIAVTFLAGALMVTVGAWPRLGALLIYVTNIGLQHRNPYILNNGDRLFVILAALAIFLPWGARYSVDAWRRARKGLPELRGGVWAQRLIALRSLVHLPLLVFCQAALRRVARGHRGARGAVLPRFQRVAHARRVHAARPGPHLVDARVRALVSDIGLEPALSIVPTRRRASVSRGHRGHDDDPDVQRRHDLDLRVFLERW